jgi:hypothetical protein
MFELDCTIISIFKPIHCAGIDLRFTLTMGHDDKKEEVFFFTYHCPLNCMTDASTSHFATMRAYISTALMEDEETKKKRGQ